jgi:tetratricopeptide (TPR) repeat protein
MSASLPQDRARFATEESPYLLYNLHPPEDLEEIEAVLRLPPSHAPVLLLIGERGIGRRYLLRTAIFRLRQEGARIRYSQVDLEGFEPKGHDSGFGKYLEHLATKNKWSNHPRWNELVKWITDSKVKFTLRTATLVSLAFESSLSIKDIAEAFGSESLGFEGPRFRESDAFARTVSTIAGDDRLVIHVEDFDSAPGVLVDWLVRLRNREPGIYVALSGSAKLANPVIQAPVRRVALSPLTSHGVRLAIDARFRPNDLPDEICDLLYRYSEGWPYLIAAKMADLSASGHLSCGIDDHWRLAHLVTDEILAANFSDGILDHLQHAMAGLSEQWKEAIERTVQYAVLCGSRVPIKQLMEYQGLGRGQQDELLDLFEEWPSPAVLFDDHQYLDPGFPGELIYSFANRIIPITLRNAMDASTRDELATRPLQFLSERIPRQTRGQKQLFLHLAREAAVSQLAAELHRELEWFATVDSAEDLASMLRSLVRCGNIRPEDILNFERSHRDDNLPSVRLAMIEALCEPVTEGRPLQPFELATDTLAWFFTSHAEALLASGFYEMAHDQVSAALAWSNGKTLELINLRGICRLRMGNLVDARKDFETAISDLSQDEASALSLLASKANLAVTLSQMGEHMPARDLEEEVLEARTRLLGPEHPDTIRAKVSLAATLCELGEYMPSLALEEEVVEAMTQLLGPDHLDTITAKNNLARTLARLGLYARARAVAQEVIEARIRLLGPEHPETLSAKANLTETLIRLGEYAPARALSEEVVEAWTRVLGPEHRETINTKANLAKVLAHQGEYAAARAVAEEVVESMTRLLGPEHPETIREKCNLAAFLFQLGEYTAARAVIEEGVASMTRLLGPEHPETIGVKANLAATLFQLGEYLAARAVAEEVVASMTRLLGREQPETSQAKAILAVILSRLGQYAAARAVEEEVVEARTRLLGSDHPQTISAKANLAATLSELGEYLAARALEEDVVSARTRLLGLEHPDTIQAKANLAATLARLGEYAPARALVDAVAEATTRLLGPEHPDTINAKANLAATLAHQGQYAPARALAEEVFAAKMRLQGPEHPDTISAKVSLAATLARLGEYSPARALVEEVVDARTRLLGAEHPDTIAAKVGLAWIRAQQEQS